MIKDLVQNIKKELEDRLHNEEKISFVDTFSLKENSKKLNLAAVIIGIYKDKLAEGYSYESMDKSFKMKKHPLYFNIDIAFLSLFKEEKFLYGLDMISSVAAILNSLSVLELTDEQSLQKTKIAIKVHDYSKEELNNLWTKLGISYVPSIFCNFSSIMISDDSIYQVVPRLEKFHYESNSKK